MIIKYDQYPLGFYCILGSPNQSRMVYTALYTNLEDILPVQKKLDFKDIYYQIYIT